jgi:hypothetical protein
LALSAAVPNFSILRVADYMKNEILLAGDKI